MGMWKSNGGLDGRARVSRGECINHELDHNTLSVCVCVCVCVCVYVYSWSGHSLPARLVTAPVLRSPALLSLPSPPLPSPRPVSVSCVWAAGGFHVVTRAAGA